MSVNNFVETFKEYAAAIVNLSHKADTKSGTKALENTDNMLTMVFDLFAQLNPTEFDTINAMTFSNNIPDNVLKQFKKKMSKKSVKPVKTVNMYTGIFTPVVRDIIKQILQQWDLEEPEVRYDRITSINSIASKIYKNITNVNTYTDTYKYVPSIDEKGVDKGVIVASCSNIDNAAVIIEQYANIIEQIEQDKAIIEENLKNIDDSDAKLFKQYKNQIISECIQNSSDVYSTIEDYVIEFTNNYREPLRDMCIAKPIKTKKVKVEEIVDETPVVTPVKKTAAKKTVAKRNVAAPIITPVKTDPAPIMDDAFVNLPNPVTALGTRVEEEEQPQQLPAIPKPKGGKITRAGGVKRVSKK